MAGASPPARWPGRFGNVSRLSPPWAHLRHLPERGWTGVLGNGRLTRAAGYSTTTYPYDTVAYIVVTYPDGESFQGSGVIIGAHTVLTASHLWWDASDKETEAASQSASPAAALAHQRR